MIQKEKSSYGGPIVFGAGLPRTGTMSLRDAMGILGLGPCHHFSNAIMCDGFPWPATGLWTAACNEEDKQKRQQYIREAYAHFPCQSAVDYPTSLFVDDLAEMYPNAKFIHGVRSSKEAWRRSLNDTVGLPYTPFYKIVCLMVPRFTLAMQPLFRGIQRRNLRLLDALFYTSDDDAEIYDKHNEWVKRVIPPERRLEFEAKDGWKPLCEFLELPIPTDENGKEIPYPHINDTKSLQKGMKFFIAIGLAWWGVTIGTTYVTVKYLAAPLWKSYFA